MADGLARSGVRKLLIFNSHGGNPEVIRICTRVLRQRFQILAVKASWGAFGLPDGLIAPEDAAHDLHAGFVETSMMLHLRPELVRRHAIAAVEPKTRDWEEDHDILMPEGIVSFGWQSEDIHPSGVIGNPSGASAEAGSAIIAHCADMVGKVLRDMARFGGPDLTRLSSIDGAAPVFLLFQRREIAVQVFLERGQGKWFHEEVVASHGQGLGDEVLRVGRCHHHNPRFPIHAP